MANMKRKTRDSELPTKTQMSSGINVPSGFCESQQLDTTIKVKIVYRSIEGNLHRSKTNRTSNMGDAYGGVGGGGDALAHSLR